jgi:hypothetical protein
LLPLLLPGLLASDGDSMVLPEILLDVPAVAVLFLLGLLLLLMLHNADCRQLFNKR